MIELKVHHHDKIFISVHLASFEADDVEGDIVLEGPYVTVRTKNGSASIKVQELIELLLEHVRQCEKPTAQAEEAE